MLSGPAHQLAVRSAHAYNISNNIMLRGPKLYCTRYSATWQFFSTTALHLLRQWFLSWSVCLCVCMCVYDLCVLALQATRQLMSDTNSFSATRAIDLPCGPVHDLD